MSHPWQWMVLSKSLQSPPPAGLRSESSTKPGTSMPATGDGTGGGPQVVAVQAGWRGCPHRRPTAHGQPPDNAWPRPTSKAVLLSSCCLEDHLILRYVAMLVSTVGCRAARSSRGRLSRRRHSCRSIMWTRCRRTAHLRHPHQPTVRAAQRVRVVRSSGQGRSTGDAVTPRPARLRDGAGNVQGPAPLGMPGILGHSQIGLTTNAYTHLTYTRDPT